MLSFLASCAHMAGDFFKVRPGMTKGEVTQILGAPVDRSFSSEEESWMYRYYTYGGGSRMKQVNFRDGKVVSLGNDFVEEQRGHEIEKAMAGATRIHVGVGMGNAPLRCDQWNAFGHYPRGGGCNVHGCWPPGGECTVFGCSATSQCGAVSCPNRIQGKFACE
jgi:hypothetical protein